MAETMLDSASKISAGYAAMVADFAAASAALKNDKTKYATTLAAAYGAFAAGYAAATAAADQAGATDPFPLLPLPGMPVESSPLDVLTLAQAAEYLQLSEDAVRDEATAGRIAGQQVGGEWRFLRDCIIQWLRTPKKPATRLLAEFPTPRETPEEYEAFKASIAAYRDEVDRATGSGKYAPE